MSAAAGSAPALGTEMSEAKKKQLFAACFVALIATAFGFILRALLLDTWKQQFNLTAAQVGEINGAGLWPFAISIILFSLIIDKVGYGKAMIFAFACHVISGIMTITATGYSQLYWANFIVALANGTVEAVINPVIATVFAREKTKWLNMLHAGWPGGLVIGGVLAIALGSVDWKVRVGIVFIPTIAYGLMMLGCKFPVQERVAAGVSDKEMLGEFGMAGTLICSFLMFSELGRVFQIPQVAVYIAIAVATLGMGAVTGFKIGQPLFILLALIMIPLATTELGVDSWVTSLMGPEMKNIGIDAGWILVFTSAIMMILRFFAGPIVHKLSPLGLLATCSAIAMAGLIFLSKATGITILVAATMYGIGKTFFWPTMLGIVAEQFPKGGALTLNATGGVGMLGVGIVGSVFLGFIQDTSTDRHLKEMNQTVHERVTAEKTWLFGKYNAPDPAKVSTQPKVVQDTITEVEGTAKKEALSTVAIFPAAMLVFYIALLLYFKSKGGYQAEVLSGHAAEDEKFTGGVSGPAEA
jgi:MFS family permease